MHRMMAVVGILVAVICVSARAEERPLNKAPQGFTNLFDGKDLSGWRGRQQDYSPYDEARLSREQLAAKQGEWDADLAKHWRVDAGKGEIVSDGHGVYLTTGRDYGECEFYVDWLLVIH